MKTTDFQKFLFRSAVSAMAVDGEVHDTEIEEICSIVEQIAYFFDFEFEKELEKNVNLIKENGKEAINEYINTLEVSDLNEKQEIILLEVLLRVIHADAKLDKNEIKFLQLVSAKIKVSEEVLVAKFPKHFEYLIDFSQSGSGISFDNEINLK